MRSKRSRRALLMGSALAALPSLCAAQNFTWTTPTNASFSVGPWNPTVPNWGGAANSYAVAFTNFTGAPYTATNDLGAPFVFGVATFSGADSRSITINNAPGNELSVVNSIGNGPAILAGANVNATIAGRMNLASSTAAGGSGTLNLTGVVTGAGGFRFGGNSVLVSGLNQNTGTSSITGGTLSIASNFALGSGTFTVAGGTLRNPNPGSTLPNIVTLNNGITLSGALTYNAPALADLLLAGSMVGTGGITVTGTAGSVRLSNATNTFTGGVTFNSGTTSFNAHLIYSGNQGIGTGSVDFQGNSTGELIFNGINSATIPLVNVGSTSTAILAAGGDQSTLNVGSLSGAGSIVLGEFSNGGTVNLIGGVNTNNGPISFFSGVTKFASAAALGNAPTLLFAGGTVVPTATMVNSKPIVLSDYTAINSPAGTTLTNNGGIALDPAALNDALLKNGAGTFNLEGNCTARFVLNSGTLRIDSGTIRYTGAAPVLSTTCGGFYSDASSLAAGNLPTGGAIAMAGGRVGITGPENLGTLSLATNSFNNLAITGAATFGGVTQQLGAAVAYGDFGTLGSTNFVRFTNAPSGSLLIGGGGAVGTPSISILAGTLVEDVGTLGFTDNFATYDAANGVRALTPGEYATTITSGATDLNNASITTAIALAAPTAINSLSCKNAGAVSGNTTLTVNSGLLLNANVSVATLSFPQPAVIYGGIISSVISGTSVLIAGSTSFSGANSYSGPTIIASGTLTDGASEVIPDTSIVFVNANALNGATTWNLNGFTETVAGISQQNVVNSGASFGIIQLGTGTLIVGSGNVSSSFAGNVSGSGHVVKTGTGTLELSGKSSTFSLGLIIRQGIVMAEAMPVASSPTGNPSDFAGMVRDTVSGDSVLGSGSIFLMSAPGNSAELRMGRGVTDLSRPIFVGTGNGAGTCILSSDIDPNHGTPTAASPSITSPITITNSSLQLSLSSGTLSGLISGGGSLVVNSNPVAGEDPQPIVTITNASNSYTGGTTVINGSLYVGGSLAHALGNSASINLGSSATTGYAELSALAAANGFNRIINVVPGQPGSALAFTARAAGTTFFEAPVTLGATALRLFSAPDPIAGAVGTMYLENPISGSGSLIIGGGVSASTVMLGPASSTYTGGTTLTDGTLALGGNSTPTIGSPTSGPIGTGSLIVSAGALPPTLIGLANGVTVGNPLMLNSDVVFAGSGLTFTNSTTFVGERVVTVNSFNVTLSGPIAGNGFLDKDGTGTLVISSSNTFTQGISVFAGSLQLGASETMPVLNVGGTAKAVVNTGGNKVLRTNALNIATGGVLDLTDEDAILDYTGTSPLPRIAQLIARGYNGGSWNGTGITSSRAQAIANSAGIPNKTAIGFAEASTLGISSFDGQSVDGSAILMRYTFMGDANLDGVVNALDFNAVASNFGGSNRTWASGDFTYDGQVNTLDFNWIAINFNQPPLPSSALGALVPEPCFLTLPFVLLLGRRVRRRI